LLISLISHSCGDSMDAYEEGPPDGSEETASAAALEDTTEAPAAETPPTLEELEAEESQIEEPQEATEAPKISKAKNESSAKTKKHESTFSYKRKLSYEKCSNCGCKRSLDFKTVSTDLTSKQKDCAAVNNEQDRRFRDLTQGGTSGGLLGLSQEGCGDDCYHDFEYTTEGVETVTVNGCY
jgi:hypothetical protein